METSGRRIKVIGEIDTLTTPLMFAAVIKLAQAHPDEAIEVDLAGVSFMDTIGLHAFARLRKTLPNMRTVNPSDRLLRLLGITGLAELILQPEPRGFEER